MQKSSFIGQNLMQAIDAGDNISKSKAADYAKALKAAKKDRAQVELMVIEPIESLLRYCTK